MHARGLGCQLLVTMQCLSARGGAEAEMRAPGSGCKHRLSSAETFDRTETLINQPLADSYQSLINEWRVTGKLHLAAGFIVASEVMYSTHTTALGGRF